VGVFATGGRRVFMCVFVGLLPRKLEIACINPHQTGFMGKGPAPPGRGSAAGRNFLASPYYSRLTPP